MASSDAETAPSETSSTPPSLEELSRRGLRALLLPWIIGVTAASSPSQLPTEVLVLVNYRTGSVTMIEGSAEIESFLRSKDGPVPASKASIEAMPAVKVEEEEIECAICLTEFEVNGEAKEMPCKHLYHGACIEKWLRIHGSCPICRYKMPAEEEVENTKGGDDDDHEEVDGGDGDDDGDSDDDDGDSDDDDGDSDNVDGGVRWRESEGGLAFHVFIGGGRDGRDDSGGGESGSVRVYSGMDNDGPATPHMDDIDWD